MVSVKIEKIRNILASLLGYPFAPHPWLSGCRSGAGRGDGEGDGGRHGANAPGVLVLSGVLKKLKTNRRKFFVLRGESEEAAARLEYYDTERKFQSGTVVPNRIIPLRSCFNINRRNDTRHRFCIAIYTKDDCFGLVLESEAKLEIWLRALLDLQHGDETEDGEPAKPLWDHIWQVTVCNRGLGMPGLLGQYRLCLDDDKVTFVKCHREEPPVALTLSSIRSCGSLRDFVFLEVGRSSILGAGEVWMETCDHNIAFNIHTTIYHYMLSQRDRDGEPGPPTRPRSSSATEATRPTSLLGIFGRKRFNSSNDRDTAGPSRRASQHPIVSSVASFYHNLINRGSKRRHSVSGGSTNVRDRCDSMPSRPRTTSEGTHPVPPWSRYSRAPHSSGNHRDQSHSPPAAGSPLTAPPSTDSASSSYSLLEDEAEAMMAGICTCPYVGRTQPDEAIAEEDCVDGVARSDAYVEMTPGGGRGDAGYVEMSPSGRDRNSASVSSSSITSGTPSTDMRFAEYPLEKVTSYLIQPSTSDNETGGGGSAATEDSRPARAYSVGSRPDPMANPTLQDRATAIPVVPCATAADNHRSRAFSCGAKTKRITRILPHQCCHLHGSAGHHAVIAGPSSSGHGGSGATAGGSSAAHHKSSSAPILTNSSIRSGSSYCSSNDQMGDLMEMDFSGSRSSSIGNSSNSSRRTPAGYVEMKPPGASSTTSASKSGYVEMKPGVILPANTSVVSPYVEMTLGTSPAARSLSNDYMDMNPRKKSNSVNSTYSNHSTYSNYSNYSNQSGNSHQQQQQQQQDTSGYMDMTCGTSNSNRTIHNHHQGSPCSTNVEYSGSPPDNSGIMNARSTPEGYVEMSVGKGRHNRQSSLDGSSGGNKKRGERGTRSQPIAIQNPSGRSPQGGGLSTSSSPLYAVLSTNHRKYSTGTPPTHLPLAETTATTTPYSSLPRQRRSTGPSSTTATSANPTTRATSTSESASSSAVTTPSSSSTIFPLSLNSPCSPLKPPEGASTTTSIKVPQAILNTVYKKKNTTTPTTIKQRTNSTSSASSSDYVNFIPTGKDEEDEEDYALMGPDNNHGFTLISAINEEGNVGRASEDEDPLLSTYEVLPSDSCLANGYELCSSGSTIVGSSRPASVNSDRELHYAHLDLAEDARSPRPVVRESGATGYASIDFVKSEELKKQNCAKR